MYSQTDALDTKGPFTAKITLATGSQLPQEEFVVIQDKAFLSLV
jgi:hypothetical protein